jgi:hypothetical protein
MCGPSLHAPCACHQPPACEPTSGRHASTMERRNVLLNSAVAGRRTQHQSGDTDMAKKTVIVFGGKGVERYLIKQNQKILSELADFRKLIQKGFAMSDQTIQTGFQKIVALLSSIGSGVQTILGLVTTGQTALTQKDAVITALQAQVSDLNTKFSRDEAEIATDASTIATLQAAASASADAFNSGLGTVTATAQGIADQLAAFQAPPATDPNAPTTIRRLRSLPILPLLWSRIQPILRRRL